jgi:hypothetical protein
LQRVFQTRLGLPDRIEVLDPGGKLLASITATEGAIVIVATSGARFGIEGAAAHGQPPQPPPSPEFLASLTVRFEPPKG